MYQKHIKIHCILFSTQTMMTRNSKTLSYKSGEIFSSNSLIKLKIVFNAVKENLNIY